MTARQREEYIRLLSGRLSEKRFTHSLNVAEQAVHLARLYGADEEKAELAGLLHDVMKEADRSEQMRYIRMSCPEPSRELMAIHALWHSFAAPAYLEHELGITDPEILDAVRYHSSGRAGMSLLERIVYLADYTSAERSYNGIDEMRKAVERDLDEAMIIALSFTLMRNAEHRSPLFIDTISAYNDILLKKLPDTSGAL